MSTLKYGVVISRLRDKLKVTGPDAFMTDRQIWFMLKPWLDQAMKELDAKGRLMPFNSLFQTLDSVPLIEVDKVEAGCTRLKSGFTIMRTKDPIGEIFMEAYWGNMIRSVSSLDGSELLQPISPEGYINLTKLTSFKYNKTLYYWDMNDHLYFPNIPWKAVKITALVDGDISQYKCNSPEECLPKQEQSLNVPDYILARAETLLLQSLATTLAIPTDLAQDNINNSRS